ncbi:hypothetical protein THAOC_32084 [Thalassiosira oceanica]|uniref:Uncharacterized protein n=1 Tax=Thalassiosira oceanica TaxID=159749 RepID=K0R6R8_THAOC|nr:hypothetical protein THAOC_32084 [Thalassiosira oceanica]|eukprot:EJK49073.1 hypothetical protein THAOC_32084 [Thalassiosira oceanica]
MFDHFCNGQTPDREIFDQVFDHVFRCGGQPAASMSEEHQRIRRKLNGKSIGGIGIFKSIRLGSGVHAVSLVLLASLPINCGDRRGAYHNRGPVEHEVQPADQIPPAPRRRPLRSSVAILDGPPLDSVPVEDSKTSWMRLGKAAKASGEKSRSRGLTQARSPPQSHAVWEEQGATWRKARDRYIAGMADDGRAKRLGDLSRLNSDLMTTVASFVGASRELLNLALTCKSFGWRQPGAALDWSLSEEVARQVVLSGRNDIEGVRRTLPQYVSGRETWLSILHESESEDPLKFDTLFGRGIEHQARNRKSVRFTNVDGRGISTAVASNYVMESGIHYAEFQMTAGHPSFGIVRPIWTNWDEEEEDNVGPWEGDGQAGDTTGMLLNLDEGTLTVYKNNRRLDVMKYGLSGPYCWYATLREDSTVAMKSIEPPSALETDDRIELLILYLMGL